MKMRVLPFYGSSSVASITLTSPPFFSILQLLLSRMRSALQQITTVLLHVAMAPSRMLRNGLPVRHKGMGSSLVIVTFVVRLPGRLLIGQRISFFLLFLRADLLLRDRYVPSCRDSMWTRSPALRRTAAQLAVHVLSLAWFLMLLSSVSFLLVIGIV
jgi:hypothetical protein